MKNSSAVLGHGLKRVLAVAAATIVALGARAAGPFTVSTAADSHATNAAVSALDGTGNISVRSAIEAANAQSGATTIIIPPGAYSLSLGELDLSTNANQTATLSGAGPASTIISQTDPTNRVFNIDLNSLGGTATTLSGITLQGGHDGADLLGGAGILAGSITATPKDVLTLSNCVVQNNHCATNTTREPGGGIQMAGGDLNLVNCAFTNNSSGQSLGGAVFTLAQSVISSLNVTNSSFVNNSVTNLSSAGPDGGGAIMIETPAGSVHNLVGCTFLDNHALGNVGDTYGGAVQINGGALNLTGCTFLDNFVTGLGGLGGALYVDSGTVTLTGCRLVGNIDSSGSGALYNHGSNLAVTIATNDWWGCNNGPGAAGCDVAGGDGNSTNLVSAPWLILANTAAPNPIFIGQNTTLTAGVLQNSAGQTLSAAQVGVLLGLPISWKSDSFGSLSLQQPVIQANGQATAVYINANICNAGTPSATLDNATATANVTVQCSDLTLAKTDNVGGSVTEGNGWTWTLHVANTGPAPATFPAGSTIALDNLPNAYLAYGSPTLANVTGVAGTPAVALDANDNLTVTAPGAVTLNDGASFDVKITATPAATGAFANPRSGGLCMVDPYNVISESNEGDNSATDTVTVTCPPITATVSGSTDICPGGSAVVTVAVSGGIAPYSISLNNGGGTQTGNSPFYFTVSPSATTTYELNSGSDAEGCPASDSGSATVTLVPPVSPAITLTPPSVFPNSAGNQASVPGIYSSYAWSIANGTIIGPADAPVVTYVAGASNRVSLSVSAVNAAGCVATGSATVPVTTGFSVHTNVVFADALDGTGTGMTFDGTNYWACSGGSTSGTRLAQYSLTGALLASYAPGIDFRSLTVRADGILLARGYNTNAIYQQTSPGVFVNSGVTLAGTTLAPQSAVVLNAADSEYHAMFGGVISRWSTNGAYLGAVNLIGYGALPGESLTPPAISPANRALAVMGNLWLTYNGTNVLSLWDAGGNRVTQLLLSGAGTSLVSSYSFSYSNGKVFILDAAGGSWRAFDLYSSATVAVLAAEADAAFDQDITNKIAAVGFIPAVDLIPVYTGATPSLAQLRNYQSVMVFSDYSFADPNAMGDVLADYLDQGGGVVVQPLAFATNGASYGLAGRISTNGYLPFTATTYAFVPGATLVKDLPSHPLLDGVNSLNSGTDGILNSPMYTNTGAFQAAHWNNGLALAGGQTDGAGRCAGLNFFPPSSDAYAPGWVSSTDGARLMANALLWSGRIPPTLLSAPASQALPPGATASFSVTAVGTSPLAYQWRLNGTNLLAATNRTLSVPVQAANFGAYSVVVSNLYGLTTSLNAQLNPQLFFLKPVIAPAGGFSLYLADSDGSAVAPGRAARVNLYTSASVSLPFSLWTLLTNAVVSSGTQLRADGFSVTNSPESFFRAFEAP